MESTRYGLPSPKSPTESSKRIAIDTLLNPESASTCESHCFYPTRKQPPPYIDYPDRRERYSSGSSTTISSACSTPVNASFQGYNQTHFRPLQYLNTGYGSYDGRPEPTSATSDNYNFTHHHHHHHYHSTVNGNSNNVGKGPVSPTSSPTPYRRERFPSVSSGTSSAPVPERRRPPRPKYDEEEMYFIWYHRVDLGQEWKQVRECFNAQFPNRQRTGFQGIQCKYYRFIKEKNCPTLREQRRKRSAAAASAAAGGETGSDSEGREKGQNYGGLNCRFNDDGPAYGVIRWTGTRFPWMKQ
ncbi:hypothetical protein MGYG_03138 [Nannizzia gypsea CBS 118893]|uniref:Myb-like domain-containing protein n=1 Tax=Arthroderma gypseum (strain ATCC MYA-4604 / CBS 118893) TaxID=535722 RepID=E4UR17_ARTGP|nr:hypothetical protein MGYG_03138 [Nannizzia gypsea CBS 118893]EFR00132.1 hypothetical protein MGYG_03138 [Nannizzia gypsea CBS 118893]